MGHWTTQPPERAFLDMGRNLLDSRPTLVRGKSCASISRNFAALGLHMDPNCGAATPHSPLPGHERREMDLFLQLRAAYARWLSPVVHDYASVWFAELWRFLMDNAVTLLAEQVSAVTIGLDFQPVSHTDSDFAPTVLVCVLSVRQLFAAQRGYRATPVKASVGLSEAGCPCFSSSPSGPA